MSESTPITHWIDRLRQGDDRAGLVLWDQFYPALLRRAQDFLRGSRRAACDEEDVVLDAFDSFLRGVQAGRFPNLNDRDDLWRLLFWMTERKAIDQRRHEEAAKRGGDRAEAVELELIASPEPTPELAAIVAERLQHLLALLPDDTLRRIAVHKLEGYTNDEIARQLDCGFRTVERKLGIIRTSWLREVQP